MNELELTFAKDRYQKNNLRKREQFRQYVYYSGDNYNMLRYLDEVLAVTYRMEEIKDMQKQVVNITKKIVNQQSVVYSEPALRKIKVGDVVNEDLTKYYRRIMPDNINTVDKTANRHANLSNVSLTHVLFSVNTGKFRFKVSPSYLFDADTDEEDNLSTVKYQKYAVIRGVEQVVTVVWTKNSHYYVDSFGNQISVSDDYKNDYEIITFADFVVEQQPYYWGEGQNDLINVNEQVNFLLTKLINSDIISGTEGIPLFINLKESILGMAEDDGTTKKIRLSRKRPIFADGVTKDDVLPDAKYINSTPYVKEITEFVDWYIRLIANMKGLDPNRVLGKVQDTSDYQKIADLSEQIEIRRDTVDSARQYEQKRFNIVRTMNNMYYKNKQLQKKFDLKEIPEDCELVVDFADLDISKTVADKVLMRRHEAEFGISTPVDWYLEKNPDVTKEIAEEEIKKNKEYTGSIIDMGGGKDTVRDFMNSFDKTNRESLPINRGNSNA